MTQSNPDFLGLKYYIHYGEDDQTEKWEMWEMGLDVRLYNDGKTKIRSSWFSVETSLREGLIGLVQFSPDQTGIMCAITASQKSTVNIRNITGLNEPNW